ncbi:hypothetical protein TcCL_ESM08779 [Trypanosoma cruzi]|nr:hypothetical protein TcCL_ESM08779 [Trypanosoma cruzi]
MRSASKNLFATPRGTGGTNGRAAGGNLARDDLCPPARGAFLRRKGFFFHSAWPPRFPLFRVSPPCFISPRRFCPWEARCHHVGPTPCQTPPSHRRTRVLRVCLGSGDVSSPAHHLPETLVAGGNAIGAVQMLGIN